MFIHSFPEGAILRAKTPGFEPDHYGIAGRVRWDGTQEVIHSRPPQGVQISDLQAFAHDRLVEVVAVPYSPEHGQAVPRRAYSQIGRPWTVFANCEHFAMGAFSGVEESPQLRQYAGVLFIGGLVWWALTTGRGENRRRG